jgi:hypothetical protein
MFEMATPLLPLPQRPTPLHPARSGAAPLRRSPADPRRPFSRLRSSGRRAESVQSSDARRGLLDPSGLLEPEAGTSGQRVLGVGAPSVESGFKNVVCMTLYNEPFEQLKNWPNSNSEVVRLKLN